MTDTDARLPEPDATPAPHGMMGHFAAGIDKIQNNAEQLTAKIANHPAAKPVLDIPAIRHIILHPVRLTGAIFMLADSLVGFSGLFSKGKDGEKKRNYWKMTTSALGIANSITWMAAENPEPEKKIDTILTKLDAALEHVTSQENGAIHVGPSGIAQIVSQLTERALHDKVALGGNFYAIGAVPMFISGVQKKNVGEFANASINAIGYGALNFRGKDALEASETPEGKGAQEKANPSWLTMLADWGTSTAGLLGGVQDIAQKNTRSGIFQVIASSIYMVGGLIMARFSDVQRQLATAKTLTAERPEEAQQLYDRTIQLLGRKGLLTPAMDKQNGALLDAVSEYLADLPHVKVAAANASDSALRAHSPEHNRALIRAGLQSSLEASQQRASLV